MSTLEAWNGVPVYFVMVGFCTRCKKAERELFTPNCGEELDEEGRCLDCDMEVGRGHAHPLICQRCIWRRSGFDDWDPQ